MNHPCAIFDFDGTLVDSMPYWQQEERDFLAARGVTDPETVADTLELIKPMSIGPACRILIERFGFSDSPEEAAAYFATVMGTRYRESLPAKEGAREYLEALKRNGVHMAVASGTSTELMDACLRRLGLREYFDSLLCCMDVGAGKDHPDVYYEAARRLGADPAQIAVYEDSDIAMRTAKQAGFYGVGMYDPQGADHWQALQALADESFKDWPAALRALRA